MPGIRSAIRKVAKWLGIGLLGLLVAILIAGNAYRIWGKSRLEPAGRMVSVGTHSMHIDCVGSGTPTVVLDIGQGGFSGNWSPVMEAAEPISRICAFDRRGMGWSEVGPAPYTAQGWNADLEALLRAADELPPYVLVGQSLGGGLSWLYAQNHTDEVAGIVMVDGVPGNVADIAREAGLPPGVPGLLVALEKLGLRPLLFRFIASPGDQIFLSDGLLNELGANEALDLSLREMGSLGDLPLIVMTHTEEFSMWGSEAAEAMWQRAQADMLTMSTNSKQVFVPVGHGYEPLEYPEMIAEAIRELVMAYRLEQSEQQAGSTGQL